MEISKINFFKKLWYSIAKPSKYEEMRKEGVWSSIKYFLKLIALLSIILAIVSTSFQSSFINEVSSTVEGNTPGRTFAYFISYSFAYYLTMFILIYLLYILLISVSLWIVTKISKQKWDFKKSVMNTIYASTLSIIIYVIYIILTYLTKFIISYMDVISIMTIYFYIFLILRMDKLKEEEIKSEKG